MSGITFTDGDVLVQLEEHLDYENTELGISPTYTVAYTPTVEQESGKPKSPLLNW